MPHPAPPPTPDPGSHDILATWRDVLLVSCLFIWALFAGASLLIPLALAMLLFLIIVAVSDWIRWRMRPVTALPSWVATLFAVVVVMGGFLAVVYVLASQANQVLRAIPGYEAELDRAMLRLANLLGSGTAGVIREWITQLDMSRLALSAMGRAGSILSVLTLILIYVAFMLAERKSFARKIKIAFGSGSYGGDIETMMQAISASLRRYIGVKTFTSSLTALLSYAVFRAVGLEFAETWAVLTFALNFIPTLGSIVAVGLPVLVSLVQFETLGPILTLLIACGVIQMAIGYVLDPALTGRSLNLSALMVILALTFWGTLWGLLGAFLSVPLTACAMIVFSHVPVTQPLAVMMSKDGDILSDRSDG